MNAMQRQSAPTIIPIELGARILITIYLPINYGKKPQEASWLAISGSNQRLTERTGLINRQESH